MCENEKMAAAAAILNGRDVLAKEEKLDKDIVKEFGNLKLFTVYLPFFQISLVICSVNQ